MGQTLGEAIVAFTMAFMALISAGDTTPEAAGYWLLEPTIEARSEQWADLAWCETSQTVGVAPRNISDRGGRGNFHGYFQFHLTSWNAVGGTGNPKDWSYIEQQYRSERLFTLQGANAWPGCRAKYAPLRGMPRLDWDG